MLWHKKLGCKMPRVNHHGLFEVSDLDIWNYALEYLEINIEI